MAARATTPTDPPDDNPILATELDDVLGHDLIKTLLARMLEEERLPQALLFAGSPLLGKRSMAIVLAKRLLSGAPFRSEAPGPGAGSVAGTKDASNGGSADRDMTNMEAEMEGQDLLFGEMPEEDPGDESPEERKPSATNDGPMKTDRPPDPLGALRDDPTVARRVARGAHLDFSLIQPEMGSKVVKIEQVRSLQDWAWISPSEGKAKVVLVFGADTITEEAANSFLKLLEEPPPKLTLILVSDYPNRLLETVRSRCALFSFHPIPLAELETWLRKRQGLDGERSRLIAGLSEGRPGLALRLVGEESIAVRRPLLGELEILLSRGFLALPGVAARCLRHAGGLRPALEGLLLLLRDAIVLADQEASGEMLLGADLEEALRKTFAGVGRPALLGAAEAVSKGLDLTRHLFIPSEPLVLENVLADVGVALRRSG